MNSFSIKTFRLLNSELSILGPNENEKIQSFDVKEWTACII